MTTHALTKSASRRTRAAFLATAAVCTLATAAASAATFTSFTAPTTFTLSGNTATTPTGTFNRPAIGGATLSTLGTAVPYTSSTFSAPITGPYTFSLTSTNANFDQIGYVYTSAFSAASPLANLVVPGVTHNTVAPYTTPIVFRTTLTSGSYRFVTTGYENTPLAPAVNSGAFSVTGSYGGSLYDIPDNSLTGVSAPLTITSNTTVASLNNVVIKGLLHPYASDLTATLSKGSVSLTFLATAGGSADFNGADYTFTATGTTLPTTGVLAPGAYAAQNLSNTYSAFNGLPVAGDWSLKLTDKRQNDIGSFTGFSLDITTGLAGPNTWITDNNGTFSVGTNWSSGTAPAAPGDPATFANAITAPRTVTVSAPVTTGDLTLASAHAYTLAGTSPITLSSGSPSPVNLTVTAVGPANTHTITAPINLASNTVATIPTGVTLTISSVTSSGATSLTLQGGGTLKVSSLLAVSTLDIETLSSSYTSFLDLTSGLAVLQNNTESQVRQLVAAWYANGAKLPQGLGSSSASAAFLTVGVFPNAYPDGSAFYSSYAGVPLLPTDILVRRTYLGDTNLDGILDATDLANLIEGLSTGATGWANGDINYDGTVNAADYALLLSALPFGGTPLDASPTPTGGAIPEPAQAAALLPALSLLTRRRRA